MFELELVGGILWTELATHPGLSGKPVDRLRMRCYEPPTIKPLNKALRCHSTLDRPCEFPELVV